MKNGHPTFPMLLRFQALKMRFIILLNHKWVTLSWTRNIGIFYITSHIVSASLNLVSQLEIFCPAWQWWFWRRRKQPTSWKSLQGVQRGERWHFSYHEFVFGNTEIVKIEILFVRVLTISFCPLIWFWFWIFCIRPIHSFCTTNEALPQRFLVTLDFLSLNSCCCDILFRNNKIVNNIFLMLAHMLGLIILSDGKKEADSAGFRR